MSRFTELPEPVRLEDTITSADTFDADRGELSPEEWLLKHAAG